LIALAVVTSFIAGASLLVYDSSLTPLIVGGAVVALACGIIWLQTPIVALYVAILAVFLPLGVFPSEVRSLLNRLTLALALIVWLLRALAHRRRVVWTGTSLLMAGFLVWAVITLVWASDLALGVERIAQYGSRWLLFMLLVVNEVDSRQALDGLMGALALNGWVLTIAGVGVFLLQGYQPGVPFQVLEENINAYGVSLLVALPGVLWQAVGPARPQRGFGTVLAIVYLLVSFVFVVLGGSRGSAISWLAALSAFWLWKPTRPWATAGLFVLVIAVAAAPFVFATVVRRFSGADVGDLGGRVTIWRAAWLVIRQNFWTGVGIGSGGQAVLPYLRFFASIQGRERRAIHNPVLSIWAETGLLGLTLYLSALASAVWSFVRRYRKFTRAGMHALSPYFALVSCVFAGVMLSWIKGGGAEYDPSFFLMVALLLIPSRLRAVGRDGEIQAGMSDEALVVEG
jgi:O-antigen ligase